MPVSSRSPASVWPPPPDQNETAEERAARLEHEREAKRLSALIDEAIEAERRRLRPPTKKILLLGQAESGKSTVLKNFQLHFAPQSFHAEADSWKAVIHLNTTRSVNFILDLISGTPGSPRAPGFPTSIAPISPTDTLRRLKMRLVPLRQVEEILTRRLTGSVDSLPPLPLPAAASSKYQLTCAPEVLVRGGSGWKRAARTRRPTSPIADELDDAERVLCACMDDIIALWGDADVQRGLGRSGISLQDQSGL